MADQDLTTFTEVDPGGDILLERHKCTISSMLQNITAYAYKTFPADYFANFEHDIECYRNSSSDNDAHMCGWGLSNNHHTIGSKLTANDGLFFTMYTNAVPVHTFQLYDATNDNVDTSSYNEDTLYYITIKRVGTQLTARIYSDPARTTLLDTLVLVCGTVTYTDNEVAQGRDGGNANQTTGYWQNYEWLDKVVNWYPNLFNGKGLHLAAPPPN